MGQLNPQHRQSERKFLLRQIFMDEVFSLPLTELNFGVFCNHQEEDKIFRDLDANKQNLITVALGFINSVCWVCLDGQSTMRQSTTF
jgi:hypothetical protein